MSIQIYCGVCGKPHDVGITDTVGGRTVCIRTVPCVLAAAKFEAEMRARQNAALREDIEYFRAALRSAAGKPVEVEHADGN